MPEGSLADGDDWLGAGRRKRILDIQGWLRGQTILVYTRGTHPVMPRYDCEQPVPDDEVDQLRGLAIALANYHSRLSSRFCWKYAH